MLNQELIESGLNYMRNRQFKQLLYGAAYLALSRKNLCQDALIYEMAKIANHGADFIDVNVNGNLMNISLKDEGISRELYVHKKREFYSTDFISHFISPTDIVIDIGANIGYYVLMECSLAYKGIVYALEPVPSNIYLLNKNIKLNNYSNVSIYELALSDTEKKQNMYIYNKCNWCSLNKNKNGLLIGEIQVETVSLDTFIKSYVSGLPTFIRMDVEGHEYEILKGGLKLIESPSPMKLFIEVHPRLIGKAKVTEMIQLLKRNNFSIKAIILDPPSHIFRSKSIFNKFRQKLNEPNFGYLEPTYNQLEMLLTGQCKCTPMVFFERS